MRLGEKVAALLEELDLDATGIIADDVATLVKQTRLKQTGGTIRETVELLVQDVFGSGASAAVQDVQPEEDVELARVVEKRTRIPHEP
eukprot:CAMPEP_0198648602 /NCGR_PEP_ID=MMETSP1467-20131203/3627_1 /TAXON_ID=1462469 /ORGANISM="unid. sp., Strain CCMP2135" /LENGTH=87 /DNA_ID=CAMNT_0044384333 /DNA_START=15 /DNA_END=275 /DNA_ORIENTATION=+